MDGDQPGELTEFSETDDLTNPPAGGFDHEVVVLPCGDYTMGESRFKFVDGYHICSFLKRWL